MPSSAPKGSGIIADRIGFAIVVCGEDLRIRSWNDRAERAVRAGLRQGETLSEAFGERAAGAVEEACRTAIAEGKTSHAPLGSGAPATICPVPRPDGRTNALILWMPGEATAPTSPWTPPVADASLEEDAENLDVAIPAAAGGAPSATLGRPQDRSRDSDPGSPRAEREASTAEAVSTATAVSTAEAGEAEAARGGSPADELCREMESIESLVDSLSQSPALSPAARERLLRIREQSARARALIDRVRRAAAPPVPPPTRTVCDLDGTIEAIRKRLHPDLVRHNAGLHVHGHLPPVFFPSREAESLFENLIRFGLAEGDAVAPRIEIGCLDPSHSRSLHAPGFRTFFVADNAGYTGGMASAADANGPSPDTAAISSAGAGLAIARRLVEHRGGQLWIELDVGRGSRTYFTLPCAG